MEILRLGDRSPNVELLQLALQRAEFSPGNIDGIFGANTDTAVRRFQTSAGLTSDGVVGNLTWQRLIPFLVGYTTYMLRGGDTYYRLAQTFNTSVEAIERANPTLNPNNLPIGHTITIPFGFDIVPTNIRLTYTALQFILNGLQARYPFLSMGSMGRSIMNKQLYYVSIGMGSKQVFYNASHHANEWITTPVLLKFLEDYARAYVTGNTICDFPAIELFNNTTLFIAPMVNPDGVDLVTGAISPGTPYYQQAYRMSQNYPSIPFPSGWKANIEGTDLNLNYPAGWENAREIKFAQGFRLPGPRDYVGPTVLSEPESNAMYNFTLQHDFLLTLSYHTQGRVIFWKYLDYLPPNSYEIAILFRDASGYALEETPLYSGFAGYKDWFIQQYNRPGYTIEAGLGVNPLPLSQFDEIYEDNICILTLGMTVV
jgi:g-D-glutamyl-meso-diaminopimelate peptidase